MFFTLKNKPINIMEMSFTCKNNNNKSILKSPRVRLFRRHMEVEKVRKIISAPPLSYLHLTISKFYFFYTTFILKFVLINNFDTKKQLFYP